MTARIHSILVPVDFSKSSAHALDYARDLAQQVGARLTVLHVVHLPIPAVAYAGDVMVDFGGITESAEVVAREEMKRFVASVGLPPEAETLHKVGEPARTILEEARRVKADLIVMGSHGRTGLGRLLMGSVTDRVLRISPIPVLAVRLPGHEPPWPYADEPPPAGG